MDPQKLSQLDPKLKEAYMRVMGTDVPQPQATPAQTQAPPPPPVPTPSPTPEPQPEPFPTPPIPAPPVQSPVSEPQSIPTPPPTMPEPQPIPTPDPPIPQPVSEPEPSIPQPQSISTPSNFDQMNSEVAAAPPSQNFTAPAPMPQVQTMDIKKKSHLMPILIGVAALIFLVVYALFWTKIFNFKLPFLP